MVNTATGAAGGAAAGTAISPGLGTVIGGAIGALGGLASSVMSGKSAKKAAKKANEMAIWQQLQSQKWQEYMSNTAHQREVEDLKAAGLNPVLSANSGAAAGSASIGNTPAYESTDYSNSAAKAMEGIDKMLALKGMENQTNATEADVKLKKAQQGATEKQEKLAELEKDLLEIKKPAITAKAKAEQTQAELEEENANYNLENLKNPFFRGIKAFSEVSSLALGPIAQMFQLAGTAGKVSAMKKFATGPAKETLTENYDGAGNRLGFKVHHYNH